MNQMKKEELEMTISDSDRIECAIRHIQTALDVDPWAAEIAVESMKKQIPQKPIEKPEKYNKDVWHLYCPSCENWIGIWNNRVKHGDMYNNSNSHICAYCGQAICWEDEG